LKGGPCYKSPKQEKVSHAFEHLIQNLKAYNGVRIKIGWELSKSNHMIRSGDHRTFWKEHVIAGL